MNCTVEGHSPIGEGVAHSDMVMLHLVAHFSSCFPAASSSSSNQDEDAFYTLLNAPSKCHDCSSEEKPCLSKPKSVLNLTIPDWHVQQAQTNVAPFKVMKLIIMRVVDPLHALFLAGLA